MKRTKGLYALGLLLLAACGLALAVVSSHAQGKGVPLTPVISRPVFTRGTLTVQTKDATSTSFQVEIARTRRQQSYGLMFRDHLPQGQGMLFIFEPPQTVIFWMKDTLIPLDILYAGADGRIVRIYPAAKPHDETLLPSQEPVRYVLEIGGGEAARLRLRVGDTITFDPSSEK